MSYVRIGAAIALGNMSDAGAPFAAEVAQRLQDRAPEVRREAAVALSKMGDAGAPFAAEVAQVLQDMDPEVRRSDEAWAPQPVFQSELDHADHCRKHPTHRRRVLRRRGDPKAARARLLSHPDYTPLVFQGPRDDDPANPGESKWGGIIRTSRGSESGNRAQLFRSCRPEIASVLGAKVGGL